MMIHRLLSICLVMLVNLSPYAGDHHCTDACEPGGPGHESFHAGNDGSCHWDGDRMHCTVSGGWGPGDKSDSYGGHGDHDDGVSAGGYSFGKGHTIPDHPEIR